MVLSNPNATLSLHVPRGWCGGEPRRYCSPAQSPGPILRRVSSDGEPSLRPLKPGSSSPDSSPVSARVPARERATKRAGHGARVPGSGTRRVFATSRPGLDPSPRGGFLPSEEALQIAWTCIKLNL
ncbi:hypothetical protein NL676_028765 [Syzygium grande]|nr:hypothetical protein NL676_028765 [Syzygium grande]